MPSRTSLIDTVRSNYALKIALIALAVVGIVGAISLVTYTQVSEEVTNTRAQTIETNAQLESERIGEWISGEKAAVQMLSHHREIQPASKETTRIALRSVLEEMPAEVAALHVVERGTNQRFGDRGETIAVSTDDTVEGEPVTVTNIRWGEQSTVTFNSTTDTAVSWVYDDAGYPSIAIGSPTPDGEHVIVAVYRTHIRAEQFNNEIEGTNTRVIGGTTADVLFDANKSNVHTLYKDDPRATAVGQRVLNTDPSADLQGSVLTDTSLIGYSRIPGEVDWVVVKEVRRSTALNVVRSVERDLSILIAMTLVGFGFIGLLFHRGPLHAISQLADQANTIADGELSVEIEDEGRSDEVGQIRSAFRNTQHYLLTIEEQAVALSDQKFDANALEADVPGKLGDSLQQMHMDLERHITEAVEARKEAEAAQKESEELASHLQEKAQDYSETMQVVSSGNLTQRMTKEGKEESMDKIAVEFNEMITEIEKTIGQLKSYVDEVEEAGEEVEQSAMTVTEASEQVAYSIQKISDDTTEQQDQLRQISTALDAAVAELGELSASGTAETDVEECLTQLEDVSRSVNEIATLIDQTRAESENVAGAAEEQAAELTEVSSRAEDLQRYATPLRDILQHFQTENEHEFVFTGGQSTAVANDRTDSED